MEKNKISAPVVLFCYNRLDCLKQTVEALLKNDLAKESELYIFSDGAKKGQEEKVKNVRDYIHSISGFKNIIIEENPINKGLANSIIEGVTKIVNKYEKVIVLEDDIIVSSYFLEFMNKSLKMYEKEEDVVCITGYVYPLENKNLPKTFFIKGADCWSWATWKRAWNLFNPDGKYLFNELVSKKLGDEFTFNNSYPFMRMLKDQIEEKNNSWAIRWYASAFLENKLCLYPNKTMVQNIGFGEDATHCKSGKITQKINNSPINFKKIKIKENPKARKAFEKYFLGNFCKKERYGFFGDYKSWESVSKKCRGYDAENILNKTLESTLAVKEGRAVFERDSVIFDEIQYSEGLLNSLKTILKSEGRLNVLDFGGALGSHYFQNRNALEIDKIENWTVVEQEHYIKIGNEKIADNILNFKNTIDEVEGANVLILSSVLQYLEKPYEWLEKIINKGIKYIIIDRTAFNKENRDKLTLQIVPPEIYEAKYPAWFLNEEKFLSYFDKKYVLISDFDVTIDKVKEIPSKYKGYFLKKSKN